MILSLIVCILTFTNFIYSNDIMLKNGQEQYEIIQTYSKLPKYGDCWKKSLENVKNGCRHLNEDIQTKLSIMFTYCLSKHLRHDLVECEDISLNSDMTICYDKLKKDSNSFTLFSEFFTHTQSICFFLQNQVWNEETHRLIHESKKVQKNLLSSVELAVQSQAKLIETNEHLRDVIKSSVNDVQTAYQEIATQTNHHKDLLFQLFDKLTSIQTFLVGEFNYFYSLTFYICSLLLSFLFTSTKKTYGARLSIFLLLTTMLFTEFFLINATTMLPEELYENIWLCRKLFAGISLLAILSNAFLYEDSSNDIQKVLYELKNENRELKSMLKTLKMDKLTWNNDGSDTDESFSDVSSSTLSINESFLQNVSIKNCKIDEINTDSLNKKHS